MTMFNLLIYQKFYVFLFVKGLSRTICSLCCNIIIAWQKKTWTLSWISNVINQLLNFQLLFFFIFRWYGREVDESYGFLVCGATCVWVADHSLLTPDQRKLVARFIVFLCYIISNPSHFPLLIFQHNAREICNTRDNPHDGHLFFSFS